MGRKRKEHREEICGIYKITNKINGKCYIGQSIDIYKRWYTHKSPKTWAADKGKVLYRAFVKYGIENFTFEIIEECSRKQLDIREKYWVRYFDSYSNGYNMTKGGQGNNHRDWLRKSKNNQLNWFEDFVDYIGKYCPTIYSTFEEVKSFLCPYAEDIDDIEDDNIIEELDGYDTLFRDFTDGYDNFEQWAECNLI